MKITLWKPAAGALLIVLLSLAARAQTRIGLDTEKLFGPVRTLRVELTKVSPVNGLLMETELLRVQTATYNPQGKFLERTLYRADGSVEHSVEYVYDREGRELGWKEYYGKAPGLYPQGHTRRAAFNYDEQGRAREVLVYTEDKLTYKTIKAYDARGNKIQEITYNADGSINAKRLYVYDAQDRIVEETYNNGSFFSKLVRTYNAVRQRTTETAFKEDGAVVYTVKESYDSRGNRTEFVSDGEYLKSTVTFTYDARGRLAETNTVNEWKLPEVHSSHDPEPGKIIYTYNERGQIIVKSDYYERGSLRRKYVYTFDKRGRLLESAFYKGDEKLETKLAYEYDAAGNRVKTTWSGTSKEGRVEPYTLERRIITYY